jgi:hypothetical protein
MRPRPVSALLGTLLLALSAAPAEPQQHAALQDTVAYTTTTLRLRAAADTTAAVLAILAPGTRVQTDDCTVDWCHALVPASRRAGFLSVRYLSLTPPEAGEPQGRGYMNSQGVWVPSPQRTAGDSAPPGATARCRDGTYSFSQSRRGTCSHHGGVAKWLRS